MPLLSWVHSGGGGPCHASASHHLTVVPVTSPWCQSPHWDLRHCLEEPQTPSRLHPSAHPALGAVRGVPALEVPLAGSRFRTEPLEGSEQDRASFTLLRRRKILRLVSQWVLLYGRLLQGDRSTTALLQVRARGGGPGDLPPPLRRMPPQGPSCQDGGVEV